MRKVKQYTLLCILLLSLSEFCTGQVSLNGRDTIITSYYYHAITQEEKTFFLYYPSSLDSAIFYGERLVQSFDRLDENPEVSDKSLVNEIKANGYFWMGILYLRKGYWRESIQNFVLSRDLYEQLKKDSMRNYSIKRKVISCQNNIGHAFLMMGELNTSLNQFLICIDLYEELKIKDTLNYGISICNLGTVQYELKNYGEALNYMKKCYPIILEKGSSNQMSDASNYLVKTYLKLGDTAKALEILEKPIAIRSQGSDDEYFLINRYNDLSSNYLSIGKTDSAIHYANKGIDLKSQIFNTSILATLYLTKSQAYSHQQNEEMALASIREAYLLFDRLSNYKTKEGVLMQLIKVLKERGETQQIALYNQELLETKDSIFKQKLALQVDGIKAKIDLRLREKEVELIKVQKAHADLQSRFILIGSILAFLLLGAVAIIFRLRHKKKRKELQDEVKKGKEQLSRYAEQLIKKSDALNEVRISISRELPQNSDRDLGGIDASKMNRMITNKILTKEDWEEFKLLFHQVYPNFISLIKSSYPSLTAGDTRLLVLMKIGLDYSEMGRLLGISSESVRMSVYRLRKKLNVDSVDELKTLIETSL